MSCLVSSNINCFCWQWHFPFIILCIAFHVVSFLLLFSILGDIVCSNFKGLHAITLNQSNIWLSFSLFFSRNLGWGTNIPNMTFFSLVIIFFWKDLCIWVTLSNYLIEKNIGLNFSSFSYDKVKKIKYSLCEGYHKIMADVKI